MSRLTGVAAGTAGTEGSAGWGGVGESAAIAWAVGWSGGCADDIAKSTLPASAVSVATGAATVSLGSAGLAPREFEAISCRFMALGSFMDASRSAPASGICPPPELAPAGWSKTGAPAEVGSASRYSAGRLEDGAGAGGPAATPELAPEEDSGVVSVT
jgi:hypothetical protein